MKIPDFNYPQALLAILALVTVVGLVIAATTSATAFGSYNSGWDGASTLRGEAEAVGTQAEVVRNTSQYSTEAPNQTLALVLSPETGYGPTETDRLRAFVRQGGTVVVAEDFGNHSNDLLDRLGADARVDGETLRDERYNYQSSAFPVARNISNNSTMQGIESLTLNHGTSVHPNGATVLASTSNVAYLDTNDNAELDAQDRVGTYPVATTESVGNGRVITIGDPSLFINAMLDQTGNREFLRSLLGSNEHVLLDYSHAGSLPPLSVGLLILRDAPLLQIVVGGLCFTLIGLFVYQPASFKQLIERVSRDSRSGPDPSREELLSFVRKQHPDWDDSRVERVIQGIMTRRDE